MTDLMIARKIQEMLVSSLCHELSAPINNNQHNIQAVLEELDNPDFESLDYAYKEAARSIARLRFYRIAYGSTGVEEPVGGAIALLCEGLASYEIKWNGPSDSLALLMKHIAPYRKKSLGAITRLLFNAHTALLAHLVKPTSLTLEIDPLAIRMEKRHFYAKPEPIAALQYAFPISDLNPFTIKPYFAAFLAYEAGFSLALDLSDVKWVRLRFDKID